MYNWAWDWNGGWGWAATFGVVLGLAIYVVPWLFFLLNLRGLLERVSEPNRRMSPDSVWLNFIPIFNLGWFIYTVAKVRDSVRNEYHSRGWPADDDFGYNVGLATGILLICSVVLGWIPLLGFGIAIAALVCWIIYWLKTNDLRNRLGVGGMWQSGGGPAPYSWPTPYSAPGAPMGGAPYGPAPYSTTPPDRWSPAPPAAPPGPAGPATASGTQSKRCGACGATILPGDRFCQSCGLPLPQTAQAAAAKAETPPADATPPEDES